MTINYLVTGAGRGIGRGLSRLLLKDGKRVFLVDVNRDELEHTATVFSRQHTRERDFATMLCDLCSPADIRAVVEAAGKFFDGRLDVLINNAADTRGVGSEEFSALPLEVWNASLQTNLTAPMLLSQGCLGLLQASSARPMSPSPGRARPVSACIINMSSTRAFMSEANNEAYSATKAGLLGLTQALSVSLAPYGVRANAILPGWIHVANECRAADEVSQSWEVGLSKEDQAWHSVGRVGMVEDVLRAVEYLSESGFVTGAEIVVDGGVTRKMVYPE